MSQIKPVSSHVAKNSYHPSGPNPKAAPRANVAAQAQEKVAVVLNEAWRVIESKDGAQWILQRLQRGDQWQDYAYCATREGLLCCLRDIEGDILDLQWAPGAMDAVRALPGHI